MKKIVNTAERTDTHIKGAITNKGKQKVTRHYRAMTSSKINKHHYCTSLLNKSRHSKNRTARYY